MNNEKTGQLIRSIRTEKGITQKQPADHRCHGAAVCYADTKYYIRHSQPK